MARHPRLLLDALIVASIVFLASLFGILTQPIGFLAAFWPANALLLGVMVRHPRLATLPGWIAAFAGYLAADLLTGGSLVLTLWLTAGNLAGVITGWLLFRRQPEDVLRLRHPLSILRLFIICSAAALAAAIVGSGAAPIFFQKSLGEGFGFWFASELVNFIIILPVLFTVPEFRKCLAYRPSLPSWQKASPLLALLGCLAASFFVGGPGALAFPIPALLWCSLSYSLFLSTSLTMLLCMCHMIAISTGLLQVPLNPDFMYSMTSVRLGIMLLALAPLTVASINTTQQELLRKLAYTASHDFLTNSLLKSPFLDQAANLLDRCTRAGQPAALLMLDIDHFKQVNDAHGHAVGDHVLSDFSAALTSQLRKDDLFGRLGGDEFGLLLPGLSHDEALAIAERLKKAIQELRVSTEGGQEIEIRVSMGLACASGQENISLQQLLARADHSLYQAKTAGRNQIRG